jgi:hypothetical protein
MLNDPQDPFYVAAENRRHAAEVVARARQLAEQAQLEIEQSLDLRNRGLTSALRRRFVAHGRARG